VQWRDGPRVPVSRFAHAEHLQPGRVFLSQRAGYVRTFNISLRPTLEPSNVRARSFPAAGPKGNAANEAAGVGYSADSGGESIETGLAGGGPRQQRTPLWSLAILMTIIVNRLMPLRWLMERQTDGLQLSIKY
jgi:hypothetical protein